MPDEIEILDFQKKKLEINKLQNENTKLEIEQRKLLLEEAELKKVWYKKQVWWGTIVTLLIGAASIYVAFSTNIVGLQQLKGEKQKIADSLDKAKTTLANSDKQLANRQALLQSTDDSLKYLKVESARELNKQMKQMDSVRLNYLKQKSILSSLTNANDAVRLNSKFIELLNKLKSNLQSYNDSTVRSFNYNRSIYEQFYNYSDLLRANSTATGNKIAVMLINIFIKQIDGLLAIHRKKGVMNDYFTDEALQQLRAMGEEILNVTENIRQKAVMKAKASLKP